ncbi:CheR family methyltransferase [Roseobacter ponti]|uniref:Chemotaxis protein methyltransferase n=1 Tax=Roseobacter ponti TaxID=1891787 RepID=A0A858ST50_9RHOB|nr:protein-glutamate O-methyltransferase [Roseobacter ponti]QJF51177.1 protein-glutamate O-methyltransferase [Roseobacter ponti]
MSDFQSEQALDAENFQAIAELAYQESGLRLLAEKKSMIQSRLRKRLKVLGYSDFSRYARHVCSDAGREERRYMISALTTNVSHFFREIHHFEYLKAEIAPALISALNAGKRVRIWSAGCSNGQEAYSLAMLFSELFPTVFESDFRILATDIDPNVVAFARTAEYPERLINGVPSVMLSKYFRKASGSSEVLYTVDSKIARLVTFRELNLLSDWPMRQQFDVIFCRNVVIYFDSETQDTLWPRFHSVLKPDGLLFLGHSERISQPEQTGFQNCGPTTYRSAGITRNTPGY